MPEDKKLTVRMDPDLHRRLKVLAARESLSVQALIDRFVRYGIDRIEAPPKQQK